MKGLSGTRTHNGWIKSPLSVTARSSGPRVHSKGWIRTNVLLDMSQTPVTRLGYLASIAWGRSDSNRHRARFSVGCSPCVSYLTPMLVLDQGPLPNLSPRRCHPKLGSPVLLTCVATGCHYPNFGKPVAGNWNTSGGGIEPPTIRVTAGFPHQGGLPDLRRSRTGCVASAHHFPHLLSSFTVATCRSRQCSSPACRERVGIGASNRLSHTTRTFQGS
jgi:hypothetical protein